MIIVRMVAEIRQCVFINVIEVPFLALATFSCSSLYFSHTHTNVIHHIEGKLGYTAGEGGREGGRAPLC